MSPTEQQVVTVLSVAGITVTFVAFVDPPSPPVWSVFLAGAVGGASSLIAWWANRSFLVALGASVVVVAAVLGAAAWVDSTEKLPDDHELAEPPLEETSGERNGSLPSQADLCTPLTDAQQSGRFVFGVRGPQPMIVVTDGTTRTIFSGSSPSIDSDLLALVDAEDTKTVRVLDLNSDVVIAEREFEGTITGVSVSRLRERAVVVESRIGDSRILVWDYLDGAVTVLHDPSSEVGDATLSPDGRSLLWVEGPQQDSAVLIAEVEAFTPTKVAERGETPGWSPDGSAAVFAGPFENGTAILRTNISSGDTLTLSSPVNALDSNPAVSPDCSQLLFTRATGGQVEIWTIQNGESQQSAESVAGAEYDLEYDLN